MLVKVLPYDYSLKKGLYFWKYKYALIYKITNYDIKLTKICTVPNSQGNSKSNSKNGCQKNKNFCWQN